MANPGVMGAGGSSVNFTLRGVYVAVALLLLTMAFILVKTGRDALYIQDDGVFQLKTSLSAPEH